MTPRLLVLVVLAACGPKPLSSESLSAPPELPAPRAPTYTRAPTPPKDVVVARLVREHAWDESLAGAAAGLALNWAMGQGQLRGYEVREAAWQAGWPWPITEVRGWTTEQAAAPPQAMLDWLDSVPVDRPIGLVRARGQIGDVWVGLRSDARVELGPQPRQVETGSELVLPVVPGAGVRVVDPTGRVEGASLELERRFAMDVGGEWLFEVRDAQGLAALFPVYAGMVPPQQPPLTARGRPDDPDKARSAFLDLTNEVRDVYGYGALEEDLLIGAAARSGLAGRGQSSREIAEQLGYDPGRTWRSECRSRTIEDCVDSLLWSPTARPGLLVPTGHIGVAAELTAEGVHVVVLTAAR